VSDSKQFGYIIGSKLGKSQNKVERFDIESRTWSELPSLIATGGGMHLSCCYFKDGVNNESLWVFNKVMMQTFTLSHHISDMMNT
jgi:hypothetical protein